MNEDKSTRYKRLKRRVSAMTVAWSTVFLVLMAASGASLALRGVAEDLASMAVPAAWQRSVSVGAYIALLTLLHEMVAGPLGYYGGFVLERRYGLSRQSSGDWAVDQIKAVAIALVLGMGAGIVLYGLIGRFPVAWWLPAAAMFALLTVGLANVAPLILLPLFYTMKPLANESLRARLVALGERAGARVLDAYEWGLGEKTAKANAEIGRAHV